MSKVAYYYRDDVANFTYGEGHPMKPYRIRLAHELISSYQLLPKLAAFTPVALSREEMLKFHCDDFIDFLAEVGPQQQSAVNQHRARDQDEPIDPEVKTMSDRFYRYGADGDCPMFENLYHYCELYSGGSVGGAWKLNRGSADIAINWAGGLHHAKKAEVSGFCYVNDIVLSILELLRYHPRVLYIDIDVHHGDGVEEAFYTTDRVMTVSFHRHGDGFFPCTGAAEDVGEGPGKNYALNFPLKDGIDDLSYQQIFKSIIGGVMQHYQPTAIVLQCGADSLTGDKLGPFNLTLRGHASCVEYCKGLGVPLLLLGGGGYTVKNVARAWAFETATAIGADVAASMPDEIPVNNYIRYWGPDYKLHIDPMAERENVNTRADLQRIEAQLLQQLKELPGAPSVPYSTQTGRDSAVHGWRDDLARAAAESSAMDSSADGAVQGRQHGSEFFAGNQDQDATTFPMGIVRPKPAGTINQPHNNNTATAAASSPMDVNS